MAKDSPPPLYKRGLNGFAPANDEADAFWRSVPLNRIVKLEGKLPRNPDRLRLYWVVAGKAAENMEEYEDKDSLHLATKIELGLCKPVRPIRKGGKWGYKDGSIAFDKMPEHLFAKFVNAAFELWAERLKCTVEELVAAGREEMGVAA